MKILGQRNENYLKYVILINNFYDHYLMWNLRFVCFIDDVF